MSDEPLDRTIIQPRALMKIIKEKELGKPLSLLWLSNQFNAPNAYNQVARAVDVLKKQGKLECGMGMAENGYFGLVVWTPIKNPKLRIKDVHPRG